MNNKPHSNGVLNLFNTPLETGLRALVLLGELNDRIINLDRLIIYDYFMLHGNDYNNKVDSLHPPVPHRAGEILIKREIIQEGINLMYSRELLDIQYSALGIYYKANKLTNIFLSYFDTDYFNELRKNSKLVITRFQNLTDEELQNYVSNNFSNWGGEFTKESLIRGW